MKATNQTNPPFRTSSAELPHPAKGIPGKTNATVPITRINPSINSSHLFIVKLQVFSCLKRF